MNFDRIAPVYGLLESGFAGGCMRRCREAFLNQIPKPQEVLIIGEGHGRFLSKFRRKFPDGRITVVDGSGEMLKLSKAAVADSSNVKFVHSMIEDWRTGQRFDLIVTNFVLDCIPEAKFGDVISHIASLAAPEATWLIAEFHVPETGPAKWRSRSIVGLLYLFFRVVAGLESAKLISWAPVLEKEGFILREEVFFSWKLLKCQWWNRGHCASSNIF